MKKEIKECCNAKLRKKNAFCRAAPMPNGRCRLHGGKSPVGIAAGNFKHGRYSNYLPGNLAQNYEAALADDELTSLNDEIALVDTQIKEKLLQLRSGETAGMWAAARKLVREHRIAIAEEDFEKADRLHAGLEKLLTDGRESASLLSELRPFIELRRKLVQTESKRRKDLEQGISSEQAFALMALLSDIVRQHVEDPKQLAAISRGLKEAVNK